MESYGDLWSPFFLSLHSILFVLLLHFVYLFYYYLFMETMETKI